MIYDFEEFQSANKKNESNSDVGTDDQQFSSEVLLQNLATIKSSITNFNHKLAGARDDRKKLKNTIDTNKEAAEAATAKLHTELGTFRTLIQSNNDVLKNIAIDHQEHQQKTDAQINSLVDTVNKNSV